MDGTSLEIEPNSFVVLVGGSGTGKSSLLTCITGTAPCTAGSVRFDGLDTRDNRNAFDAVLGYVPQKDIMHDNLTVEQKPDLHSQAAHRPRRQPGGDRRGGGPCHRGGGPDRREKTLISQLSAARKSGYPSPWSCWPVPGCSSWTSHQRPVAGPGSAA